MLNFFMSIMAAWNTIFRRLPLLFLFCILTHFLYSQEDSVRSIRNRDGTEITQIISFSAVRHVIRYEVEIEKNINGRYVPENVVATTINHIEVSLDAGNYRFRYTAFNSMNMAEEQSQWQNFVIYPADKPEITNYQPFYALYYELKEPTGSFTITGSNFSAESEFALVKKRNGYNWTEISLEGRRDVIFPHQVEAGENQARLTFLRDKLKSGTYEIFIRNPGGLWTAFGRVRVGFKSIMDFTLSFSYSPTLALFDINNAVYEEYGMLRRQLDRFNMNSYTLRLGWLPIKTKNVNFGLEAQVNFLVDRNENSGSYNLFDYIRFGTANLLFQIPYTERFQHNIRLGTMYSKLGKISFESYHMGNTAPGQFWYFNLGYSVQYFIWKNLYAEIGLDLVIARNFEIRHNHLMIRPSLGFGWQFGKWAEHAEIIEAAREGRDHSIPAKAPPAAEFLLSTGWSPMIPMFGIDPYAVRVYPSDSHGSRYLQNFNPAGLNLRYVYIPYRWGRNRLGFELEINFLDHQNSSNLDGTQILSGLFAGIRYQRILNNYWNMNVRAAAGMSQTYKFTEILLDFGSFEISDADTSTGFGINLGASVQFFVFKNIYLEAGFDMVFIYDFSEKAINRAVLRPGLYIGYQLRNDTGLRLPGTGLPQPGRNRSSE
jgi:hypothetical protein